MPGSCLNRRVIEDDLDGGHAAIRADAPPRAGTGQATTASSE